MTAANSAAPPSGLAPAAGQTPPLWWVSEVELIGAVAGGSHEAFAHLHLMFERRILGAAQAVTYDPLLAQDAAQDVLLEIWRKADQFQPERGSLTAWILVLTRARAIDRVRSAERGRRRDLEYAAKNQSPAAEPAAETAVRHLESRIVHELLMELSAPQREAVTLIYLQGWTSAQASKALNIPLATFKTRLRDALIRLRRHPRVSGLS